MNVKRLKELLENKPDNMEIFIRNSVNPCGNIQELRQVETSTYSSFGVISPCIILNTYGSKELECDEEENIIDNI